MSGYQGNWSRDPKGRQIVAPPPQLSDSNKANLAAEAERQRGGRISHGSIAPEARTR